jgi:hypothetical protein
MKEGMVKSRRGETIIAVRFVNGTGQKVWHSKADCCRDLGIAQKTLNRCIRQQVPVIIRGQRWLLDVMAEWFDVEEDDHADS